MTHECMDQEGLLKFISMIKAEVLSLVPQDSLTFVVSTNEIFEWKWNVSQNLWCFAGSLGTSIPL